MRSARNFRFSASSGENPRSRNTLPVDRRILVAMFSLPLSTGLHDIRQALAGEVDIGLARLTSPFLKGVQDVHCFRKFGDVEDPMFPVPVSPDLIDARA